jgi:hypothetical protein
MTMICHLGEIHARLKFPVQAKRSFCSQSPGLGATFRDGRESPFQTSAGTADRGSSPTSSTSESPLIIN